MTDEPPAITPAELYDRMRAGDPTRVLDIRDRESVEQWRITGDGIAHTHVPRAKVLQAKVTDTLDELVADLVGEGPIVVVCAEGRASAEVAGFLADAGYDAQNLAEGMDGWADLYVATDVSPEDEATVLQYHRPSSGCLAYLLVSEGEAAVIDPLDAFTDRYRSDAAAHDATLTYAVDTHVHADHVSGVASLAAAGVTAVIPEAARERGVTIEAETVADGDTLSVRGQSLTAVHAPGHTTDMTAFHTAGVLFSGDSLFLESVARPDLEADAEGVTDLARTLYDTLHERLAGFTDDTLLAPGHYGESADAAADGSYTAPLGEVRGRLSVLDLSASAFVERITSSMPPQPANYERIIAINLGTASVPREEALTLELGPNNCAAAAD